MLSASGHFFHASNKLSRLADSHPDIDEIVDFYLPTLATAGAYARAIQNRVRARNAKDGANTWARALTDADPGVQSFIEVATLGRWPNFGFCGEESEQSPNTHYFDAGADTVVHLDPINGTYLYQTGQTGWDIVLSISHRGRLQASISYVPMHGRYYLATSTHDARTLSDEYPRLDRADVLATRSGSRVVMTYQAPRERAALEEAYDCFDIVEDHDPGRDVDNLNDLFTGRLEAFVCRDGSLLDWGAAAFIVSRAGGVATQIDGAPLTTFERYDSTATADFLVASNAEIHADLVRRINA